MTTRPFAGIDGAFANMDAAQVLLQSIPFDGTSTWGKGADKGFEAFMEAAENMEVYDIETGSEVYRKGVFVMSAPPSFATAEAMYDWTYSRAKEMLKSNKLPTFFGGEHSISIGVIDAMIEAYPDITILQLDAHTDLRPQYEGTEFNHACALYRASQKTKVIQVGIRSMDSSETQYIQEGNCFYGDECQGGDWVGRVIDRITGPVYITIDLDAFDPSIMPATGTPEPGGLQWYPTLDLLKQVFEKFEVKGFDIVELAPIPGFKAPQFLAAKLYYKLLSYYFFP
jgi:agmatinase